MDALRGALIWIPYGPNMAPIWVNKWTEKMIDFWIALGKGLGRQKGTTTSSYPPVLGPRGGVGDG